MPKLKFIHINHYSHPIHVRKHVHSCYEFIYYTHASGTSDFVEDPSIEIEKNRELQYVESPSSKLSRFSFDNNTLILYPPYTVHDETHIKPADVIAVGFSMDDLNYALDRPICRDDPDRTLEKIFHKISREYREKQPLYEVMIASLLTQAITALLRSSESATTVANPMRYAKAYINEYFTTDINIGELAAMSGYSIDHFRVLFKNYTGLSPKSYILNKRYEYAKILLLQTTLGLEQIAYECGFDDYSQFSIYFKKMSGLSPRSWRKENTPLNDPPV